MLVFSLQEPCAVHGVQSESNQDRDEEPIFCSSLSWTITALNHLLVSQKRLDVFFFGFIISCWFLCRVHMGSTVTPNCVAHIQDLVIAKPDVGVLLLLVMCESSEIVLR